MKPSSDHALQLWRDGDHRGALEVAEARLAELRETKIGQQIFACSWIIRAFRDEQPVADERKEPFYGPSGKIRRLAWDLLKDHPYTVYDDMIDGIIERSGSDAWAGKHRLKVCNAMSTGEKIGMFIRHKGDRWTINPKWDEPTNGQMELTIRTKDPVW